MHRFKKYLQENFQVTELEWESIEPLYEIQLIKKNEYFVQQGKVCRYMGFIAEGVMRYCMFRDNGEDLTCYFMSENQFIGDPESFINQKPSVLNAQALTKCAIVTISLENQHTLLHQIPRAKELVNKISLRTSMELTDQKSFMLGKDASARYQEFMRLFPHILQRIPLSYVASYLGIKQQSLSRLRNQRS